jgi:hypothetical protein
MLTHQETQRKIFEQIAEEARRMFLTKAPKFVKKIKGAARK